MIVRNLDPEKSTNIIRKEIDDLGLEDVDVKDCQATRKGNLLIKCKSEVDLERIKNKIRNSELKEKLDVVEKTVRIIIFSVPQSVEQEDIETKIKIKYPSVRHLTFVKKLEVNDVYHQTIQLDTTTAMNLINDRRLLLKMTGCPIRRYVSLARCYRCQRTGHVAVYCDKKKYDVACEFCGLGHESRNCPNKEDAHKHHCVNCSRENRNGGKKLNIKHAASSAECLYYRNNLKAFRNNKNSK